MAHQANSQPRHSIRTNLRQAERPIQQIQLLPIVAKSSITVCMFIIIYFLIRGSNNIQQTSIQLSHEPKSNQTLLNFQFQMQEIDQSNASLPMIPLVSSLPPKCEKTKKQQLEESLRNIQIFQLIRTSLQPYQQRLEKYFMKVQPISVVKHPKFTSPLLCPDQSILGFDFWSLFKRNDHDQQNYKNIHRIFNPKNTDPWNASGMYLTLFWQDVIRPMFLTLRLKDNYGEKYLYIYGISVVDSVLVNRNTFEYTLIKKAKVKGGQNKIECDELACAMEYSMLMLVLDPMYTHKKSPITVTMIRRAANDSKFSIRYKTYKSMHKEQDPKQEWHRQKRSPGHTKQHTLNNSRSRINENKHKHRLTEQNDPDDNIRMINQSMVELQDPQFIADQIDQFQSKLVVQKMHKGFCQVTREQSLLLSNTQGYRKYKIQAKANHITPVEKEATVENPVKPVNKQAQKHQKAQIIVKKEGEGEQQSLCYSSESQTRRRIQQKQISNISNTSGDVQKNEQAADVRSLPYKHQSF